MTRANTMRSGTGSGSIASILRSRSFWLTAAVLAFCIGLLPQAWGQTPTVTGFVGSSNVPQTNSVTMVQAPPSSIVVQGSNFAQGMTSAVFGAYQASAPQVLSSTTMVVQVPAAFAASAVGTTTTLAVCNATNCATGGATITLTVTAPVPSMGTITATPSPTTTVGTTTIGAQFARSTTNGTTLPQPGAPSGTVTFTAAGSARGSAPLILDSTATFVATTTTTTIPTVPTPILTPGAGTYPNAQVVAITDANAAALIYYTTDGTPPTVNSNLYKSPFVVPTTETISAIAVATGSLNSAIASAVYNIFIPIPTSIAFVQQPTTTPVNTSIAPPITVAILDQNSNVITNQTGLISMSIGNNPGNATLSGTTQVAAVNGIATFSDLSIPVVANSYTLLASAPGLGLPSVTSGKFNIIPPPITVTLFAPLVGVTSTLPGSFTLSVPAGSGGVTVNLASSVPANVTVSPATVTVPAGGTTGSFTYTGVAPGAANITAAATNYTTGTATVTATYSLISLGTIPSVAPGQSVSIALSIATAAPAGGLTVSFTSSNPSVASVTSSVFIPAGQRTAMVNPQIVGNIIGTTNITGTAPGYAPDTRTVPVTVVASFSPGSITIAHQTYSTVTLNISQPATTGGITFTISSDATATATVPTSVTIPAGQTSVVVPLTGVADGTTIVRADSPGVTEAKLNVSVSSQLAIYYGATTTGVNLQTYNYAYVPSTPATPITLTVTSSNPAVATLAMNSTTAGVQTLTFPNIVSASNNVVYVQGLSVGTSTITVSAPGYTTGTNTITVDPSGFIISTGNFSTTTFSTASNVSLQTAVLNSGSLTVYSTGLALNPGLATISLPVSSSSTTVGTITSSPVMIQATQSAGSTTFLPAGTAGMSTISLGTPTGASGFSIPASSQSIVATVTAPNLSFYYGNQITGVNMMTSNYVYVPVSPPNATTLTVTSSNPAVATVSNSATVVGTATLSYPNITTSGNYPIYIQGQSAGTTTLTVTGSGFNNGTITVTVYPSGFTFAGSGGFSTTTFSTPTTLTVYPTVLNPSSLTYYTTGTLNPGLNTITVPVTSSNTATGTITSSPLSFPAGSSSASTSFQPSNAGTSTITIGAANGVGGFSTPSQYLQQTATVTAPQLAVYYSNPITGVNMMQGNYAYVPVSPPSAVTVTVTSSNPAVATISTSSTAVGTAMVTFPNVTQASDLPIYLQGQTTGTTTLTISAPGYATGTTTLTVYPSGFTVSSGSFSTTTFSSPTTLYLAPTILSPSSLAYYTTSTLNPGLATVSVPFTSANTTVGTIGTSPVTFAAGSSSATTTFQPLSAGTSVLSLGSPSGVTGFSTPSNDTSITATVTAPQLSFSGTQITGVNLEVTANGYLPVAPPNAVTVTIVSNGPGIALISTSATTAGSSTVTFTNVTNAGYLPQIYIQGQAVGSTTLTISAPGYSNAIMNVTVNPSGFTFGGSYNGGLSTTATSGPTTLYVYPSILNNGTLTYYTNTTMSPVAGGVSVPVTSSNTAAGTISSSPLVFTGGTGYLPTTFVPVATGTTNIGITQPSGYSSPSQYVVITATVQ